MPHASTVTRRLGSTTPSARSRKAHLRSSSRSWVIFDFSRATSREGASRLVARPAVAAETPVPVPPGMFRVLLRVRSGSFSRRKGSHSWSAMPFTEGRAGISSVVPPRRSRGCAIASASWWVPRPRRSRGDLLAYHPTVQRGEHPERQVLRLGFYGPRLAPESMLALSALKPYAKEAVE